MLIEERIEHISNVENTENLKNRSPDDLNLLFESIRNRDLKKYSFQDHFGRWLFAERLQKRGAREEMSFNAYEGVGHIRKFFTWLRKINDADPFNCDLSNALVEESTNNDRNVFLKYGLKDHPEAIQKVARYNMQDFMFQRAYSLPARIGHIEILLDFGAGHGRTANLAYNKVQGADKVQGYIAVDGIPSTYFTQNMYFHGLGLTVWEYFEHLDEEISIETIETAVRDYDVVHLPTWQLQSIPDSCVSMINCVQVLKELPGRLIPYLFKEFNRISCTSGAIYIRDHVQFHNPNHMPVDLLLQASGFALEYSPQMRDRIEIHGLPRIWRKVDPFLYVE